MGANRFPFGVVKLPERLETAVKLTYMEHAEQDVILRAAYHGIKTQGALLFCPWFACADCARAIIGAGIATVIGHKQMMEKTPERWQSAIDAADVMLDEAGVKRYYYDGPIFDESENFSILFNGETWNP